MHAPLLHLQLLPCRCYWMRLATLAAMLLLLLPLAAQCCCSI
jgi:hypothetical protein